MKNLIWALQAALFYGLTLLVSLVPRPLSHRLGALAGQFISRILPKRRAIVLENLDRARPYMQSHPLWDPRQPDSATLTRETFQNMGRSLMEVSRLYQGRDASLISGIELRGLENLEKARAKGKGVLCFSGHCGNWELMGLALASLCGGGAVVARRQKNPWLERMVNRMRMRYQSRVLDKQGALRGILKTLRQGGVVGILADQAVVPEEGVLIEIMGRTAWASSAPVIISRSSGAPVVPVFIHREAKHHVITFYPEYQLSDEPGEAGLSKDIQALSRYIENFVVAHPTQWYWMHRRWKRAGEVVPSQATA